MTQEDKVSLTVNLIIGILGLAVMYVVDKYGKVNLAEYPDWHWHKTSIDCKRITKERIAVKSYPLETTKIDIKKDWKIYTDKFYEDYFAAKDAKCNRLNGMTILHN